MSKLASDNKMIKVSNKVRRSASKLMMYKGPESQSVGAGMLGMAEEARVACKLLKTVEKDSESFEKLEVCKVVRKCSLNLLIQFEKLSALEDAATSTTDKTEGKSADGNFAGNKNSKDINQNKKRKRLPEIEDIEGQYAEIVTKLSGNAGNVC